MNYQRRAEKENQSHTGRHVEKNCHETSARKRDREFLKRAIVPAGMAVPAIEPVASGPFSLLLIFAAFFAVPFAFVVNQLGQHTHERLKVVREYLREGADARALSRVIEVLSAPIEVRETVIEQHPSRRHASIRAAPL